VARERAARARGSSRGPVDVVHGEIVEVADRAWPSLEARHARGIVAVLGPVRKKALTARVVGADPGTVLPTFTPDTTADEARAALGSAGWREVGTGDWAWVLASPDDRLAARVTPFDPAFRLFADACLAGPPNPFLVRVDDVVPLRHRGYVVVMERLHPADEERARSLVASLGITSATDAISPDDARPDLADHPEVVDLRRRIEDLLADGARQYRLWGGADIRPGNVLQTADGRLRLTDPVFVHGPTVFESIRDGRADLLGDFSRSDLEDFLRIPAFEPGPDTDALRRALAALPLGDGQRSTS